MVAYALRMRSIEVELSRAASYKARRSHAYAAFFSTDSIEDYPLHRVVVVHNMSTAAAPGEKNTVYVGECLWLPVSLSLQKSRLPV